ncbi:hypothetical protein PUNSTDRAFT_127584 [Punctularia strigosozonata HHB-11173 SS5]|uniref:uncharacterized protein n=1 Tax=Punctularia strigosozonata (strain HHB-11173) TaxID=741275 RepID=UPI0004416AF2|nr:uncharacterized protein PUNSTDRAFT_127584 [Punctularia strigosozonata HHB-11173 SS5]EIN06218.1 hypothetical protein PUNSTDRAFT_127584 [Punctularia strigosozonata HHB-11173 SS5]
MSSRLERRALHRGIQPRFSPTAIFPTDTFTIVLPGTTSVFVDPIPTFSHVQQPTTSTSVVVVHPTTPVVVHPTIPLTTRTSVVAVSTASSTTALISTTSSTSTSIPRTTSTSSSTILTTTSTTPTVISKVPTTTRHAGTSLVVSTDTTIFTASVSGSLAAAASSTPSTTATPQSNISKGVIAGGVSAAVIAVLGVAAGLFYLIRRCRRDKHDDTDFNAEAFRRQSQYINDDGSLNEKPPSFLRAPSDNGRGPRPPTMIERHLANMASPPPAPYAYNQQMGQQGPYPAFGPQAGAPFDPYGGYNNNGPYVQPSFAPGQIVPTPVSSPPPTALPGSAQPFFAPHGQTPLGSPTTPAPYGSAYDARGQLVRQPSASLNAQPTSTLTRNGSVNIPTTPMPGDPHYVDLNRSSVSPFQAAQYAEISAKLGAPLPAVSEVQDKDLPPMPAEEEEHVPTTSASAETYIAGMKQQHLSVNELKEQANPESPFADPNLKHADPVMANNTSAATVSSFEDDDEEEEEEDGQELELPSPSFSSKSRVASTPPMLPEIAIQERAMSPILSPSSYDFPMPVSAGPSPFAQQFGVGEAGTAPSPNAPAFVSHSSPLAKTEPAAPKTNVRPETVYDPEDAYGGI